jgi:hypothetical protein
MALHCWRRRQLNSNNVACSDTEPSSLLDPGPGNKAPSHHTWTRAWRNHGLIHPGPSYSIPWQGEISEIWIDAKQPID